MQSGRKSMSGASMVTRHLSPTPGPTTAMHKEFEPILDITEVKYVKYLNSLCSVNINKYMNVQYMIVCQIFI